MKVIILFLFVLATPVFAKTGDNVIENEDKNGALFTAGNNVEVSNKVDGVSFIAGNQVSVSNTSDYLFTAGNSVVVENSTFKDGFVAGSTVEISDSNIERDLYVAGASVKLSSKVGRNAYIASGTVVVTGEINGDLEVYAGTVNIKEGAKINGTLKYDESTIVQIADGAVVNNKEIVKVERATIKINFFNRLLDSLISFGNILLVGFVLLFLMPKVFEKVANKGKETILVNTGIGLLSFVFLPIAFIVLLISVIGISASLLALVFYMVAIYLSTIFAAYNLGNIVLKDKIKNKYMLLLVSLLIIYVLKLIPFIKVFTSLFILFLGLGIIVSLIIKRK